MPMINFTQPFTLFVGLLLFVLILFLARETKRSFIMGILLFVYLGILSGHAIRFIIGGVSVEVLSILTRTIIFDLIFVFLSFISYLWVDDTEAKFRKKQTIDNSLDWFWNKV